MIPSAVQLLNSLRAKCVAQRKAVDRSELYLFPSITNFRAVQESTSRLIPSFHLRYADGPLGPQMMIL
jgi:hypothetical protein